MIKNSTYSFTQLVTSVSIDPAIVDKLKEIITTKLNALLSSLSVELVYPLLLKDFDTGLANDKLIITYLIQARSETIDPVIEEVSDNLDKLVVDYLKNKGLIFKLSKVNYIKL